MERMKLPKSRVREWVAKLQETATVYAPAQLGEITCFLKLAKGAEPLLDYGNTDLPMKEVLFPQSECLLRWQRTKEGLKIEEVNESRPTVILGARPCDVTGLNFLDRAFTLGGIEDPYYMRRRQKTTIVALVCQHPVPGCFGPSVGVNEISPEGADVVLIDIGEAYVVEVKSEKGEAVVQVGGDVFTVATEQDIGTAQQVGERLLAELAEKALAMDQPELRAQTLLESPVWEQIYRRCLSCGICAFLCPTCYCFDICDQTAKGGGERIRCYDTCTSKIYTQQAGGHNTRPTAKERLTQRLLHKFSYAPQRLEGRIGCVGCARCRRCPVDIDLQMELSEVVVKESE
ncbi:MAG: 4Fe-4S dicluster domain-containing protein [Candidatus Zipacnadales bacterium]